MHVSTNEEAVMMLQGAIKKIVYNRGFGFIARDHRDVFFHRSSVEEIQFEDLQEGQSVDYLLDRDDQPRRRHDGPRATLVRPR
jgi:cold shock CspA family protein